MTASEKFMNDAVEFQSRLTEGMKVLSGLGEIEVGTTPKDKIYEAGSMALYRYRPLTEQQQNSPPILIVYALVNRPYIVDLHEKRSLVRGLLNRGSECLSH